MAADSQHASCLRSIGVSVACQIVDLVGRVQFPYAPPFFSETDHLGVVGVS